MPEAPRAFRTAARFRAWLAAHHATAKELIVRCFKVHARSEGMTYAEALDEALCFGWIDGVRRGCDERSFTVRFTPRRTRSVWSAVNRKRARALAAAGRMHEAGLAAFRAARASARPYDSEPAELDARSLRVLRADADAWRYYQRQPPWYRRTSARWIASAKRDETRAARLAMLVDCSRRGTPIPPLRRDPKSR